MERKFKMLIPVAVLVFFFIPLNTYALNENENLTVPDEFPHRDVLFEEENFTFPPPPPRVDMPPPPLFNESKNFTFPPQPKVEMHPSQGFEQQKGDDVMIKWYYLLPLLLIPFLLFFFMSENIVVADAEFLQQAKEDSSIFHKFKNIYVTPRLYSEISKQNKNIILNFKTTHLNKKGKEYLEKYGDETLALAKQINARIILTGKDAKNDLYEKHGFKTLRCN